MSESLAPKELRKIGMKTVGSMSPGKVMGIIDSIEDEAVRHMAASVVWWDNFSMLPYGERRPEFDKYLNHPKSRQFIQQVDAEQLVQALVKIGYEESHASSRVFFSLKPGQSVGKKTV